MPVFRLIITKKENSVFSDGCRFINTKYFKKNGSLRAVDGLSLEVEQGSIFGILGPNGSGKTTTLKIILDLVDHDSGEYFWFGHLPSKESRKKLGVVLDSPLFYPYLSAVNNLKIIADIKGVSNKNIENVLRITEIYERRNHTLKNYSYGMKQRYVIAAALLNDPKVLIFDEPTNGLDPQGIADIRNIIRKMSAEGTTVILASHLLDEVQKVCTDVVVINAGKKMFSGKVKDVLNMQHSIEISSPDTEKLYMALQSYPGIKEVKKVDDRFVVSFSDCFDSTALNRYCFEKGIALSHLSVIHKTLEKQFLEILNPDKDK